MVSLWWNCLSFLALFAVLISILLPSLARARQQALLISCSSNMRQVYQALALYAQDNKGYLPYSEVPDSSANGVTIPGNNAAKIISEVLGTQVVNATGGDTNYRSVVLRCPSAVAEHATPWADGWETNWKWNYGFHFRHARGRRAPEGRQRSHLGRRGLPHGIRDHRPWAARRQAVGAIPWPMASACTSRVSSVT